MPEQRKIYPVVNKANTEICSFNKNQSLQLYIDNDPSKNVDNNLTTGLEPQQKRKRRSCGAFFRKYFLEGKVIFQN